MVATIIITAIIVAYVGFIIVSRVKKMKDGECGCDCGCSGCSSKTDSNKNKAL